MRIDTIVVTTTLHRRKLLTGSLGLRHAYLLAIWGHQIVNMVFKWVRDCHLSQVYLLHLLGKVGVS